MIVALALPFAWHGYCQLHQFPVLLALLALFVILVVAMVLILYTVTMPFLGYLLATVIFFPVIYLIFGVRPWTKGVVVGVITTAIFYAIFAYLADLPLPKGFLENIF